MIGRWFNKKQKGCTSDDVRFLLLLCQGRDPVSDEEVSLRQESSFFSLCKTLLGSDKFRRAIIDPFIMGRHPAPNAFSGAQQNILNAGLKRHFGVQTKPEELICWTNSLLAATRSTRFLKAAELSCPWAEPLWLKEKLQHLPDAKDHTFFGAIETVSAHNIAGFAFDQAAKNSKLSLEIFVNGTFAGIAHTGLQRRDIQEQYEDDGLSGFSLDYAMPSSLVGRDNLVVHAFEQQSGVAICHGKTLPNISARHEHYLSRLLGELNSIRGTSPTNGDLLACLGRIEAELPKIRQYAALPLIDYGIHSQLFCATAAPATTDFELTALAVDPFNIKGTESADILVLVEDGQSLSDQAVGHILASASENPAAQIFFADHDVRSTYGQAQHPTFKAAFDYELLLAQPEYANAYAIRRSALQELSLFAPEAGTAKHQDLWLRAFERYGKEGFKHISQVLWHHRADLPAPHKNDSMAALERHFRRQNITAKVKPHIDAWGGDLSNRFQIVWPEAESSAKLGIIIPTRDGLALTKKCVESLRSTLAYPEQTEITIVDNGSTDAKMLEWLASVETSPDINVFRNEMPFNWSALNNFAVGDTDSDYLLFLNNDTAATEKGWDRILRNQLARPDIGTVGARLLFEDGTIQFAGYVVHPEQIVLKEAYGESPIAGGYLNRSQLPHSSSALIGAFLGCTRETFHRLGGFDENFAVAFNDIDFTLRAKALGLRNLYDPAITFYHFESKTRGYDAMDAEKAAREDSERRRLIEKHHGALRVDSTYPDALLACEPTYSLLAPPKGE
ncbi:MAG: glycosyltransferase [Alphaproteobacteria bacterium]|nr:glycosyltransferase [Alphaproteobacteria bacterium]